MKKKSSSPQSRKPKGIQHPDHPFHAFAKKKAVSAPRLDDRKRSSGREEKPTYKRSPKAAAFPRALHDREGNDPVPLNKFLAHTGLCARRKAVEYIQAGEVTVNGNIITEPGFKVSGKDVVKHKGKRLFLQQIPVYILLNKPKGYITTTHDPRERKTVMELVSRATDERIYPVGRLDRNTSGLLLLTNDGELAQQLAHPSHNMKKVYHVVLNKALTKHDFETISEGIMLEDGLVTVDALAYTEADDRTQIGLEIHSGRNRIVRRIFESLGYEIKALDRVMYAGLTKKNLPRGKWRRLTPKEVVLLKHFSPGKKAAAKKTTLRPRSGG